MRHAHAKTFARAVVFASTCISATYLSGCDDKKEPRPVVIVPTYARDPSIDRAAATPSPSAAGNAANAAPASTQPTAIDLALAADAGTTPILLRRTIESTVPVDPDQAILDAAHTRAATCYDGKVVSAVPRSATINVTVIPTGKVTRTEVVSSDTTEPEVLACLKALGEGLVFTERFEQPAKRSIPGTGSSGNTADTKRPTSGSNGGGLRTYAINVAVVPGH